MIQQPSHAEYTTFNSNISAFIPFVHVCHIQEGKEEDAIDGSRTTWIHFNNGKCMHVKESYQSVKEELELFHDNY